jgi:hypothetical protein
VEDMIGNFASLYVLCGIASHFCSPHLFVCHYSTKDLLTKFGWIPLILMSTKILSVNFCFDPETKIIGTMSSNVKGSSDGSLKKRHHLGKEPRISASEFATEVSRDEPSHVIRALRRFVTTVRQDRIIAYGIEEDVHDDESEHDERDEEVSPQKPKKLRKEEDWKNDTENYNVPFVGTAIRSSYRSDPPPQPGEWPTGLLRAYIQQSPLGIELAGDTMFGRIDKVRDTDRSLAERWTRHYLQALAALSSALQTTTDSHSRPLDHYHGFANEIITKRLPGLFQILSEMSHHVQNKRQTKQTDEHDPNKTNNQYSIAVSAVIEILCHLAGHSPRVIARNLELQQQQPQQKQNSVWRRWKSWFVAQKGNHHWDLVMLAAILTEKAQKDAVVFSCIATVGNKGASSSSGLLGFILKDALTSSLSCKSGMARLMRAMEVLLQDRSNSRKRVLLELFCQRDIVPHICQLAYLEASPNDHYHSWKDLLEIVAPAIEDSNFGKGKHSASTEARRLLYVLLADRNHSPLLQGYDHNNMHFRDACENILVRAMISLFEQDQNATDTRNFLLRVIKTTPPLLPSLFAKISVVSPKEVQTMSLASLRRLHCVAHWVAHGPTAMTCWKQRGDCNKDVDFRQNDSFLLSLVLPTSLNKQIFGRLLQSSNALVVVEALKFYIFVLRRCATFFMELSKSDHERISVVESIHEKLITALPDFKLLLPLLSKHGNNQKSDTIIYGFICEAVGAYVSTFSENNLAILADWTKLLPRDAETFCRAPLAVQRMVLKAIRVILDSQQVMVL